MADVRSHKNHNKNKESVTSIPHSSSSTYNIRDRQPVTASDYKHASNADALIFTFSQTNFQRSKRQYSPTRSKPRDEDFQSAPTIDFGTVSLFFVCFFPRSLVWIAAFVSFFDLSWKRSYSFFVCGLRLFLCFSFVSVFEPPQNSQSADRLLPPCQFRKLQPNYQIP
ncbi:hypothetical protein SLA2020_065760 [Shorea laevis]